MNLEGVQVLTRAEQKNIIAAIKVRNVQCTGNIMEYNGGVQAFECTWEVRPTFLGIGVGSWEQTTGPCPVGAEFGCV